MSIFISLFFDQIYNLITILKTFIKDVEKLVVEKRFFKKFYSYLPIIKWRFSIKTCNIKTFFSSKSKYDNFIDIEPNFLTFEKSRFFKKSFFNIKISKNVFYIVTNNNVYIYIANAIYTIRF